MKILLHGRMFGNTTLLEQELLQGYLYLSLSNYYKNHNSL
jgi:hypothetical protein